jgi:hypothetical protein
VTEHHKKLEVLVGEWNGREKLPPSPFNPQGGNRTSKTQSRMDLGGFFLIMDYVQIDCEQECYRGHGIYGWDPRQQKHTMHWFDVMGGNPGAPALGSWEGSRICFSHQHHMGHSRYTYEFGGRDRYSFKLETSQDGKNWMLFLEGAYTRA